MKLTKYGHACVIVDKNGSRLIIDPGEFTEMPDDLNNVSIIVLTHLHGDHTHAPSLRKIVEANPNVKLYAHSQTLAEIRDVDCQKVTVDHNEKFVVGDFQLSFYVVDHAVIWKTSPCSNLAVKVDDFFYYAGDSFHVIKDKVTVAGVPTSAPWLKISEAIEFTRAIDATQFIPTHNGLLNDLGHGSMHTWLQNGLKDTGKNLLILKNGESFTDD